MPKRTDIHKILIIGSGPIVIGQACEFDYSGTQACRDLKQEGFEVILVNSNPATIMTDPEIADRTYVEPLTIETVSAIIEKENPDALLPTVGGQTALNLSVELFEKGILEKKTKRLADSDDKLIYELPRERKDIRIRLAGEVVYSLMWDGKKFAGEYVE